VEIEHQRELGDTGLLEEDKYLAKVNLEEMVTSSGERQHYLKKSSIGGKQYLDYL
jgi:hypothetical protein